MPVTQTQANSKTKILEVALKLFSEKGYEAASIREICDGAGITRPTLYYFYTNKDGVYQAIIESARKDFKEQIEGGLATEGDLREKCKAMARRSFADAAERPRLWRFIFGLVWAPDPRHSDQLHDFYEEINTKIIRAADEAVRTGEIVPGDNRIRVLVLMGALSEALSSFLILGRPKLTPELADAIIDSIFDGWQSPARNGKKQAR